ncbi:MAG: tetratricopeptide repeat protein [Bacteroidota bacterium]
MKKALFLLLLTSFFLPELLAQAVPRADSVMADTLFKQAWSNLYRQADAFQQLTDSVLHFSRQKNFPWGVARAFYYKSVGSYVQTRHAEALLFCDSALQAYQSCKGDSLTLATSFGNVYNIRGLANNALGEYPLAIASFQQSLLFNQQVNNQSSEANAYHNLGMVYESMGEYDQSLSYFQRGKKIRTSLELAAPIAESDLGVGTAYLNLFKDDSARHYLSLARDGFDQLGNQYGLSRALNSLGIIEMDAGNLRLASRYFRENLPLQKSNGDQDGLLSSYINLGEMALRQKQFVLAISDLEMAYQLADSLSLKQRQTEAGRMLTQAYEQQGKLAGALRIQREITTVQDTLFRETRTRQLAEMETKYKTAEQDRKLAFQAERLEQEQAEKKQIAWTAGIGLLLLLVIFGLMYTRYRLSQQVKLEQAVAQERKEGFVAVLDAAEKERKRIAAELHDGLGQLLSTARMNVASLDDLVDEADSDDQEVYASGLKLIDHACEEVRSISHNMMPSALSRGGLIPALEDLRDSINAAGRLLVQLELGDGIGALPESTAFNLYRVVQEVINNMIKHAEARNIQLKLVRVQQVLQLTISDDGKGIDPAQISTSKGLGWQNIAARVDLLDGDLLVEGVPGKGTSVLIEIPAL